MANVYQATLGAKGDELTGTEAPPPRHILRTFYKFREEGSHILYGWLQYINVFSQYSHILHKRWGENFALRWCGYSHSGFFTKYLGSTAGAGTTTMQSVCSPVARCWDSMYSNTFKANSGLGVLVTPHLVHPYSSPTATQHPA